MTDYPRDDSGNIQVDFVWGNVPMQPDEDRGENTLDMDLDNHVIADIGWSNYPQYIPNYDGLVQYSGNLDSELLNDNNQNDEGPDADLEVVVPNFVRMTREDASDLANSLNLDLYDFGHYLTVQGVESTGKTVRVYAYDTDYSDWSNASGAALNGLKAGDELYFTNLQIDETPVDFGTIKVTKVNNDGDNSWFEFKLATEPETAYDAAAIGDVWAGPNLVNIITVQRPNSTAPGDIVNEGRNVNVRYFSLD
jgi:hypothetical protein